MRMLLIHTLQDEGGICAAVKTAQIATDGREENMEGERARWGEVYCVPVMPRRPHLCTVSQKAAYDLRIAPLLAPQARIGRCMCHRIMLVQAVLGQCHTHIQRESIRPRGDGSIPWIRMLSVAWTRRNLWASASSISVEGETKIAAATTSGL
jgi:hypothetical protein